MCSNTDASSLLESADGQCGAWTVLFIRLRQIHGMNDTNEYRFFYSKKGINAESFAVNSWSFSGSGTSGNTEYPYINILPIGDPNSYRSKNSYDFAYAEVTDEDGIAGQGNSNPASLFNNHQVMVSGQYYDPSYGKIYASLEEIDSNSIAGFYKLDVLPLNETKYDLDLNLDGDKVDINVLTYVFLFRKNPSGNNLSEQSQDR